MPNHALERRVAAERRQRREELLHDADGLDRERAVGRQPRARVEARAADARVHEHDAVVGGQGLQEEIRKR